MGKVIIKFVEKLLEKLFTGKAKKPNTKPAKDAEHEFKRQKPCATEQCPKNKKEKNKTKCDHLKPPAQRHYLKTLTMPKSAGNTIFTTIGKEEVMLDVGVIKKKCDKIRIGNKFIVPPHGRVYGYHDNVLYPISGPGTEQLDSQEYNLLMLYKKSRATGEKSLEIMGLKTIISQSQYEKVKRLMKLMDSK